MIKLSDLLSASVDQKEILRSARAQKVFKEWSEVVGPILEKKTSPDRFEKGTLWVCAESSIWAQELRMQEDVILERMNLIAGEGRLFRELRVGLRPKHRDLLG